MTTINPSHSSASYDSIKLGIDAYAKYYWVSSQVDGATPQPVQKMTYEELMLFVVKQQRLTRNVLTCDEAGAFGVHLYRRLEELGTKREARGQAQFNPQFNPSPEFAATCCAPRSTVRSYRVAIRG